MYDSLVFHACARTVYLYILSYYLVYISKRRAPEILSQKAVKTLLCVVSACSYLYHSRIYSNLSNYTVYRFKKKENVGAVCKFHSIFIVRQNILC